ncbi:MAG: type II toxin-antitoxin system RelE/ParE family toxin [Patescibacteria group bacterium]
MVSVRWSTTALANLDKLDSVIAERVVEKVTWLKENFEHLQHEKLHRELRNLYKLRVGNYRTTYTVSNDLVSIEGVGHRRDIYK